MFFPNIHFLNSYYFLIIFLWFFLLYLLYLKQKNNNYFTFFEDIKKVYKNNYNFRLKVIIISFIFILYSIILSNPNYLNTKFTQKKDGIDIVIAFDISYSMEANDFYPTRMEFAKNVLLDFIESQKTNRLWLVVYAWKPFTSIPLTFDYNILTEYVNWLTVDNINQNIPWLSWTAIWDAILMSRNLFDLEEEREKIIILLSDWDANVWIDPFVAAEFVKEDWIKIYSIWVWSESGWEIVVWDWFFEQRYFVEPLNEDDLKKISTITSWEFFMANSEESLEKIFQYLENLEKNEIEVESRKQYLPAYENFVFFLLFLLFSFTIFSMKRKEF